MKDDKRRYERVKCEFDSSYRSLEESSKPASEAVVQDISEGGIRFRAGNFVPVSHKLLVKIDIPHQKPIETVARPAWVREIPSLSRYDVGAEFIALSNEDKEVIRRLAAELPARAAADAPFF